MLRFIKIPESAIKRNFNITSTFFIKFFQDQIIWAMLSSIHINYSSVLPLCKHFLTFWFPKESSETKYIHFFLSYERATSLFLSYSIIAAIVALYMSPGWQLSIYTSMGFEHLGVWGGASPAVSLLHQPRKLRSFALYAF